jgi:phytoene dehydrogenase-like protein
MVHEVVVVGGGIGGLTVAALLAARGVDVCLLERASQVGGVVAPVEAFGYTFDPGIGIYPCWEAGEIHDQVFSELPVARPEVSPTPTAYVVRLPSGLDVPVQSDDERFFATLRTAFPESLSAVDFYRRCLELTAEPKTRVTQPVSDFLTNTSLRFRQFIDAQLQLLTQSTSEACTFGNAANVLTISRLSSFSIKGGAAALANCLAAAINQSGGKIRLNTPVLRLAYDSAGVARGVDLMTGETVGASRAIVSNLTIWDTYGKLIGLNRTPPEIRKILTSLQASGAFLVYFGIEEAAAAKLPDNRILALGNQPGLATECQLMLAVAPATDHRAPSGKRAATLLGFTDVDEWFTFHESLQELEEQDEAKLAEVWQQLEQRIPEVVAEAEVIETSTPFACYEATRRKLGMVGRLSGLGSELSAHGSTTLPNVYIVGDTVSTLPGLAGVTRSARSLANKLTKT